MKTSPTSRSLKLLRDEGYSVCVVEKWVPSTPAGYKGPIITRDAWNFGDLLACKSGIPGALLVQTTTGANAAARLAKINAIPEARTWLESGNQIHVHGWRKVGKAGARKLWECRRVPVTTEALAQLEAVSNG